MDTLRQKLNFDDHQSLFIRGWQINYLHFTNDKVRFRKPLIILGGAFQRFHSFKKDVNDFLKERPVILIDLPGQGGNTQSSAALDFEGFADILKAFIDRTGLDRVNLMALSYGSAIGYTFAKKYPENMERLILGGTTPGLRQSVKLLLKESLDALLNGQKEDFCQGVVLNLMNFARRDQIRGSELLAKSLYRNMLKLTTGDWERYQENTARLIHQRELDLEGPTCETLVIVGEHDNFTTPYECFEVARRCPRSVFTIVTKADHLASYQRKDVVNDTFRKFLEGDRLHSNEGVIVYRQKSYPEVLRQMEPRYKFEEAGTLCFGDGLEISVAIKDINKSGVRLDTSRVDPEFLHLGPCELRIDRNKMQFPLILFKTEGDDAMAIFKRCSFEQCGEISHFIEEEFVEPSVGIAA